jgi:hypothetical protein
VIADCQLPISKFKMKLTLPIFLFVIVLISCGNDKFPPIAKMSEADFLKLPKTFFEFKDDSISQALQVTWFNDTALTAEIKFDSGSVHSTYSSYLAEEHPGEDYETYEDTSGESHPMREFTLQQKKPPVNLSLKIALDTSFAVLINWGGNFGEEKQLLNRVMYLKK